MLGVYLSTPLQIRSYTAYNGPNRWQIAMEIKARISGISQGATPAFMQGAKQTKNISQSSRHRR